MKTLDAMEDPEERSLLGHLEASPAFWSPLISRISLLAPVPPVSSEAQRDFYLMASKYCPVQYTALAGKGGWWKKMGKILPQPPSQELPVTVREGLKLEIPPSVPSLEKESTQVPCWQVHRKTVDWPSSGIQVTERLGLACLLAFRDWGSRCCIPAPGLGQGACSWSNDCMRQAMLPRRSSRSRSHIYTGHSLTQTGTICRQRRQQWGVVSLCPLWAVMPKVVRTLRIPSCPSPLFRAPPPPPPTSLSYGALMVKPQQPWLAGDHMPMTDKSGSCLTG